MRLLKRCILAKGAPDDLKCIGIYEDQRIQLLFLGNRLTNKVTPLHAHDQVYQ